jgi:hypothetical protein
VYPSSQPYFLPRLLRPCPLQLGAELFQQKLGKQCMLWLQVGLGVRIASPGYAVFLVWAVSLPAAPEHLLHTHR